MYAFGSRITKAEAVKPPKRSGRTAPYSIEQRERPRNTKQAIPSGPLGSSGNQTVSDVVRHATISSENRRSKSRSRLWKRQKGGDAKNHDKTDGCTPRGLTARFQEVGIQTNDTEILRSDVIVGDVKLLLPSRALVLEIDRSRSEAKKRELLKTQRKFEEHSLGQEEHLDNLKEFLETASVSKRPTKFRNPLAHLEEDRALINSMDKWLNREIPKAESITDIKGRIERKEKELLSLFENVRSTKL